MKKKWIGIQCNKCHARLINPRYHTCSCGAVAFDKGEELHRVIGKEEDYTMLYDYDQQIDLMDVNSVL